MNTPTKLTYHSIDLDYSNELGQRVVVMTCPVAETTFALVDTTHCNCGKEI